MNHALTRTLYGLMGCFALIMAIEMLPSVIWFFWGDPELYGPGYAAAVLIPFGLLAGFGLWMLLRRPSPDAPQSGGPPPQWVSPTAAEVRTSLLLAAGMLIIGLTMRHFMVAAVNLVMAYIPDAKHYFSAARESKASLWLSAIASCIPMILGLVLVLWSSAVGSFLLRQWGRARPEAVDNQCPLRVLDPDRGVPARSARLPLRQLQAGAPPQPIRHSRTSSPAGVTGIGIA